MIIYSKKPSEIWAKCYSQKCSLQYYLKYPANWIQS